MAGRAGRVDVLDSVRVDQVQNLSVAEVRDREGVPVIEGAVVEDADDFRSSRLPAQDVAQVVGDGLARGGRAEVPGCACHPTHGRTQRIAGQHADGRARGAQRTEEQLRLYSADSPLDGHMRRNMNHWSG